MSAASNYLEDKLLDHVLNYGNGSLSAGTGAGYQPPSVVYVALFTANGTSQKDALAAALEANTSGTDADSKFGYYEVQTSGSTNYARQSITRRKRHRNNQNRCNCEFSSSGCGLSVSRFNRQCGHTHSHYGCGYNW